MFAKNDASLLTSLSAVPCMYVPFTVEGDLQAGRSTHWYTQMRLGPSEGDLYVRLN